MAELDTYLRFFFALIFVLGLIGGSAWFLKRFLLERGAHRNAKGPGRLEIVETKMIDARRKLILLRRDSVEHLLILGPNQETVIEKEIHPDGSGHARPEGRLVEFQQAAPAGKEGA